jgi:hypothetical protein
MIAKQVSNIGEPIGEFEEGGRRLSQAMAGCFNDIHVLVKCDAGNCRPRQDH